MLISAVVVPGPPAIVPELMGSAASELDDLRRAVDRAVSGVVSDLAAMSSTSLSSGPVLTQLVVVGAGAPGEFKAAGQVSFGSFGPDFSLPELAPRETTDEQLPTPLMVARYLASRDVAANPEHAGLWAKARWVTTSGADSTILGKQLGGDAAPIALIVVADGALGHGPKAPRAEDHRADAYESEVCAALGSGQLGLLTQVDAELGQELGASGAQVWPVLFNAAAGDGIGEVLWRGAPYGVGWVVATWRPAQADLRG